MTIVPSPYLAGTPSLARLAAAAPPAPLDPVWQQAIERQPPPGRDAVRDAPSEPEPPFRYETSPDLLRHLPEPARALLRRLDEFSTEARDVTVALSRHIDAARDRSGRAALDVAAAIRNAGLPEAATLEQAREMVASDRWPPGFSEPMKAHVRHIVAEGERLREAEQEIARLVERRRDHTAATAPITTLRGRVTHALGRARPPFKEVELPEVSAKLAERTLAEARETITKATAALALLESGTLHPDDVASAAAAAVARHAATAHRFIRRRNETVVIEEPTPGREATDQAPTRPLALLCGIAPEATARWLATAIPSDPAAPRLADRPRLLAETRQRLREAELLERAAIAALGDPLDRLAARPEADPLLILGVEAQR